MPHVYQRDLGFQFLAPSVTTGHASTPTSASDQSAGYHVGDIWITTGNAVYMCCVSTAGAAVWTQLG